MLIHNQSDDEMHIYLKPKTPRHRLRLLVKLVPGAIFDGPEHYCGALLVEVIAGPKRALTYGRDAGA